MARPRTPSNILELRGAFKEHPARKRKDAEGAGPFNAEPPQQLPQECVRAWREIVERLPKAAIYSTDELAVEIAAKLLTTWRISGDLKILAELRQWFSKLGLTPQDRTKLEPMPSARKNEFDDL